MNEHLQVETLFGYCDYTDDHRPFYVGIGNLRRTRVKIRNKKHTNISTKHGYSRIIELTLVGVRDEIWKTLCDWEKKKIIEYDTFHREGNIGSNFTMGGEGVRGFKRIKSEEERYKISESKKALYADPIARQKLGEAIRKAKAEPDKLRRHAEAQRKRYSDPKERLKAHEANTQKKRVQQLTLDGVIIAEFPSLSYAVIATGVKNIKLVCRGKRKVAGKFRWRYV